MPPIRTSDPAAPPRRHVLQALAPLLARLLQARASIGTLVALGIARHLLRLVPTLAIGLAVDHVASARAGATLVAIVGLLCVAAGIETVFAGAQQRLHAAMRAQLAAGATAGRRQRGRHLAALDLLIAATTAPPAMLAVLVALATSSGRIAALAALLLVLQAAAIAIAGGILGRLGAILRAAELRLEAWSVETVAIADVLRAGAQRRKRRCPRHRLRLARLVEARREAGKRMTALIDRIGFALMLGLACLEAMSAAITPGALIAVMLLLRQLQGLGDALGATWLRAVEAVAEPSATGAGSGAPRKARAPDIELVPGEFVAVIGGTAAGKSLLLRSVIDRARASAEGAAHAAWVEQQPRLCDATIAEILALADRRPDAARRGEALRASQLAWALRRLPAGLAQRCGAQGEALSAGMRALVVLAAALERAPQLLVLDALPDVLEPGLQASLLAALLAWRDGGRSLVVATAVESWIAAADRVVVVEDGRVRADLRPRQPPSQAA